MVYDPKNLVHYRVKYKGKKGVIVGAYVSEYWFPHLYRAYHIKFDDGSKDTIRTNDSDLKILK